MLTLGTDVGSGIVLHGQIWHGMNGMAGESGHISVDPSGPLCACGTRGCLELSASATGLVRMARERASLNPDCALGDLFRTNSEFTASDLFDLAKRGDCDSIEIFSILIGGGVASAWEMFAPKMDVHLARAVRSIALPTQGEVKSSE
jgi:glucokinase